MILIPKLIVKAVDILNTKEKLDICRPNMYLFVSLWNTDVVIQPGQLKATWSLQSTNTAHVEITKVPYNR